MAENQLDLNPLPGMRTADEYERLELIGRGTYGYVFKARCKSTGAIVAMKKVPIDPNEGFSMTSVREVSILKALEHPNVLKIIEVVPATPAFDVDLPPAGPGCERLHDPNTLSSIMVFEYMEQDLAALSRIAVLSAPEIKCYMRQLLTGLVYLHRNHILHRDIKASNLLINKDGFLKIADFGLSRSKLQDEMTAQVVSLWYRPPELLLGNPDSKVRRKYGEEIDIWSAACVLAELLLKRHLFHGKTEIEQLDSIFRTCGTPNESTWLGVWEVASVRFNKIYPARLGYVLRRASVDPLAVDLLERMLVLDPCKRISALDALNSPYFWHEPLPCTIESLPKHPDAHEYVLRKLEQEQRDSLQDISNKRRRVDPQPAPRSTQGSYRRPTGSTVPVGGYSHPSGHGNQHVHPSYNQGGYSYGTNNPPEDRSRGGSSHPVLLNGNPSQSDGTEDRSRGGSSQPRGNSDNRRGYADGGSRGQSRRRDGRRSRWDVR